MSMELIDSIYRIYYVTCNNSIIKYDQRIISIGLLVLNLVGLHLLTAVSPCIMHKND